ncbi:MAG: 2-amino-4-hydroxy-6-hydroxymethyldihydropteridine diphosphokinase [Candidatus Methylomirabilota bacterium]|nr:2-amino-4-hydroxy-6-hydroxymethyldihydropteridine diphosphokinase [candidate division NC10 bacterium]PWB42441.1 MAG: 2-amino-4-hydroxy-6-hydroxymethyldihydropteridine diphosphokinase [candidate division NC10 bacterium]
MGERAYIGIGSNLGDRVEHCHAAITAISKIAGVVVVRASSLYETAPVPPASSRWFVNGVVSVQTDLTPGMLLLELQRIEARMGRAVERARGVDRSIDLDLLLVGSQVVETPDLVLPHPRLHQRRFVLTPLCELDPELCHPVFDVTMRQLLDRLDDPSVVRRLSPAGISVGGKGGV